MNGNIKLSSSPACTYHNNECNCFRHFSVWRWWYSAVSPFKGSSAERGNLVSKAG